VTLLVEADEYPAIQVCCIEFMYEDPEPVIVSLAYAAGATRVMLATSALAARIPLIFRIYSPWFFTFLNLRYSYLTIYR
jgi:hypothetical protein